MEITLKIIPTQCRFYNSNNGWGVFDFFSDYKEEYNKTKALSCDPFDEKTYGTLVGNMPELNLTQEYTIKAKEIYNKKFDSWQFELISISQDIPNSLTEKKRFLNFFLTENQTNVLLEAYPNIIKMIAEDNLEGIDLNKTKGIKEATFKGIKDKIYENYVLMDIINYLSPYGVTYNKIKKIVDKYQSPLLAKQKILENFYILTEVEGIGFKTADNIALKINPDLKVSNKRLIAFIDYTLKEVGENDGHTWISHAHLMSKIRSTIPECSNLFKKFIRNEEECEERDKYYISENRIGLLKAFEQERDIKAFLDKINKSTNFMDNINLEDVERSIKKTESIQGFEYTEQQREAVKAIVNNNILIIGGKAGSGKTSVVKGIVTLIEELFPEKIIAQCALSARAARRMYEVTARPSYTIHKLLAWKEGRFQYNELCPLPHDVIVADEFSMNNLSISLSLFKAVKQGAKLILVFDYAQLPPIGNGAVAYDLLEHSNYVRHKFEKVHRQAEKSGILKDANLIRLMKNPIKKLESSLVHGELKDMIYKFFPSRDKIHDFATKAYLDAIDKFGLENVMLISPRKDKVENSVEIFNKDIQETYITEKVNYFDFGKIRYYVGDRVIHKINNYNKNVVNGELGVVVSVSKDCIIVDYGFDIYQLMENGYEIKKLVTYTREDIHELSLGYASTIHSAQGSQADIVIIALDNTHHILLDATMLYTAITRASKKCLLIAEPSAFKRCISNNKTIDRQTHLRDFYKSIK